MTGATICAQMVKDNYVPVLGRAFAEWGEYQHSLAMAGQPADEGDVFHWIGPAARGDLSAQRRLAMYALAMVGGEECHPVFTIIEGLVFARLAAAQGTQEDRWRLITMLAVAHHLHGRASDQAEAAEVVAGEVIARLEMLADEGHERAAELLATLVGNETPETIELAHEYRERLRTTSA